MAYQDLAADAGITISDEDYETFKTDNQITDEVEEMYGKAYMIQQYVLLEKVRDYIEEHVTVE